MITLEEDIRFLKVKKSMQFEAIEMLSTVNDSAYLAFGKVVAELMLKEKELIRQNENNLNEN